MAFLGKVYKVEDMPQADDFSPIPAGWYKAKIISEELKTTKAGTGKYIALQFSVLDGKFENRRVFTNLNVQNPSPKAEETAQKQIGAIMRAGGLSVFEDSSQLVGVACKINVAIRKSEEWGDKNEIKGFAAIEGSALPTQSASSQSESKATPPWARK